MFGGLWNNICYGVFSVFYWPFVALPLLLLRYITQLFQLIAIELPQFLLFGIKPFEGFENKQLPTLFLRLAIISIAIFMFLLIISIIKLHFQKDDEPNPVKIAIKNSFVGTFWIIFLPVLIYLFNMLISILLNLILGSDSQTIDQQMWSSFWRPDGMSVPKIEWNEISKRNYVIGSSEYYASIFPEMGQGIKFIMIGAVSSIATLIPLVLGFLTLITKVFHQLLLFIISPFVAAASVRDDGARMKKWQEMYITKSFTIIGFVISIQIFSVFVQRASAWTETLEVHSILKLILGILIIIGAAASTNTISEVIASFIGESASVKESLSETKGLLASGMALAGGIGVAAKIGKGLMKGAGGALKNSKLGKAIANSKFGQKMSARSKLKQAYKSGSISKQDYKNQKTALNEHFKEIDANRENDKELNQQESVMIANEVMNNKDSGFRKEDINASTKQLIKNEQKTVKQMEKLQKSGKAGSEEFKRLENRYNALNGVINGKVDRASKNVYIGDGSKISRELNQSRAVVSETLATASTQVKKDKLQSTFNKHSEAIITSGQLNVVENKMKQFNSEMNDKLNTTSSSRENRKSLLDNLKNTLER